MSEKKVITKKDWVSSFTLIGKPVINDFTYKIDERSNKSNWIYNLLNLGIDCGEKHGVVYGELMGGYSEENENKIFAYGKKEDGSTDFDSQIVVDWDDRFDEEVLKEIGKMNFITVGLEKTSENKIFYKKFLSAYDAIAYIKEHLSEDMVVNVRGKLTYSFFNNNVQVKKNITGIVLFEGDASERTACFTQTILIDKDSTSLKNIDADKGVMYINTKVLDYLKEYNGVKLVNAKGEAKGGQFPYNKQFEYEVDPKNEQQCRAAYEKVFKVKKGITQITFDGEFIESGATVKPTLADIPDNIKELIGIAYTEEEALAECAMNGKKQKRMILKKPQIKIVGDDDNKVPVLQKFEERYKEEDLVLDYLYNNVNENSKKEDDEIPFDVEEEVEETSSSDNSMDWLNDL